MKIFLAIPKQTFGGKLFRLNKFKVYGIRRTNFSYGLLVPNLRYGISSLNNNNIEIENSRDTVRTKYA